MKKIFLSIGLVTLVTGMQAQGLLNFVNAAATVIVLRSNDVVVGTAPATPGGFRYELFRAAPGTADANSFIATGLIATNTTAGRFVGGNGVAVPGTQLGGTSAILIRGWSAELGSTYAEAFANVTLMGGWIGQSAIAPNFLLGGDGGAGNVPTSPVFGGASGIIPAVVAASPNGVGFYLDYVAVPEPSSMALAGLGAASLLIFRRRK